MINYKKQAKALIDNGYHIVPINAGSKAPYISGWQDKDFSEDTIKAGVGIKCGVGVAPVCAVDIDVLDAKLSGAIAKEYAALCGHTIERVGQAPKTLLVYRASNDGWRKASSSWFSDQEWYKNDNNGWETKGVKQRIEILGAGQQFVAYHTHPDTAEPYLWVDFLGGAEHTPVSELAVISPADVTQMLEIADNLALEHGMFMKPESLSMSGGTGLVLKNEDNFLLDIKVGLSLKEAAELLANVDAGDHDLWLKMGMALHHEFDGDADAMDLWDKYSASADNYAGFEVIEDKWNRFTSGAGGVTAKTLVKLGNAANIASDRRLKHATLEDYKARIADTVDIYVLTDEVLPQIGSQLEKTDVVSIKSITDAAIAKSKEIGVALTSKEIAVKLGVKSAKGAENIEAKTLLTEVGNVARMVTDCKDTIMFTEETNKWYVWENYYWRQCDAVIIERYAKTTIANLTTDAQMLGLVSGEEYLAFVQSSMKASMVKNMVTLVRSEEGVLISVDELNANTNLFAVGNGTIDLTTGKLLPPDPLDRITVASKIEHIAGATCPVFEQTLRDVFNDDVELTAFFQRLIGYTMLGNPKEDLIVIPYGSGSNGKSTVFGAIRDVFDNHAKTADNSTLMGGGGGNGGGAREDILRLMGSRFVYASEPDENSALKEGFVKAMTGGEAMAARGMYSGFTVEVVPTWTVFMPTNHKPIIKGTDHGIWRRILPIPFERNFDTDPNVTKDRDRAAKLLAESSGILNWCVQGALEYQRIGLGIPDKIKKAREEYKDDMDIMGDWLSECCEIGPNEFASNDELWNSWQHYAGDSGELKFISTKKSLGKRLSSKGFTPFKNAHGHRGRGFEGLAIRQDVEHAGFDDIS